MKLQTNKVIKTPDERAINISGRIWLIIQSHACANTSLEKTSSPKIGKFLPKPSDKKKKVAGREKWEGVYVFVP